MTLPNFLVIGAQRGGTTLLHQILDVHPEVYVPQRRKEVHFFDWYYDRGADWYAEFFPSQGAGDYRAIGEVTPDYLFDPHAPGRIREVLPHCKFIVSLRNPIQRAFSWYVFQLRSVNEQRTFEQMIEEGPAMLERGLYSQQLARYFDIFPRSSFLIFIFEELIGSPRPHVDRLAAFLSLDRPWDDPAGLVRERVNASDIPRFRAAFARAQRMGEFFTRHDLDWIVRLARGCGIPRMFGTRKGKPRMSEQAHRQLTAYYRDEIAKLEDLLGRNLKIWSIT
jgi:Sulfotransferase domain